MKRLVALSAVLVLLLVGCGDDEGTDLDQLTSTTREESTTTSEDDSDEPDDETTTTESSDDDDDEEPSSGEPDSYGDDEELDALWDDCDDGDDDACHDLFMESPIDSDYEAFGAACGGRSETEDCGFGFGFGIDIDPDADTYGDDETLDALWDDCDDGDDDACNELFWTSPSGSEYETFGSTCGGRGDEGDCT